MLAYPAIILALSSLGLCATWGSIDDVPKLDWDFIIVGGRLLDIVCCADSQRNLFRRNGGFCPGWKVNGEPEIQSFGH